VSGVAAPLSSVASHGGIGTRAHDIALRPGVAVAVGLGLVAAFLAHMVLTVPVRAPALTRAEAIRHLPGAAAALLIVVATDTVFVAQALRRRQRPARPRACSPDTGWLTAGGDGAGIPRALQWQAVPRGAVRIAAVVACALAAAAIASGFPLWLIALGAILPWVPLLGSELAWKRERYGVYAVFVAIVGFQVLHMGEHSVQVIQLLATHGDLSRSHGVFGQLDFETVHFVFDGAVWLILGCLICTYRGENRWLWLALAAASMHEVEHLYIYWLSIAHPGFYAAGGFAGIMGAHGLVGSPLGRPYLHFAYNVVVVVPMAAALWHEATSVSRTVRLLPSVGRRPHKRSYEISARRYRP
jgi:hypothetical protein